MEELVSLDQLKDHLRLPKDVTAEDDDLQLKLDQAQAIVVDYLYSHDEAWTDDTAPKEVIAAILIQAADLYRNRGDDSDADAPKRERGYLSPLVVNLLHRLHDPALA